MSNAPTPAAISRAHHQLEMLLKPGGGGGMLSVQDELETCWLDLRDDPTVTDPVAVMTELADWFSEKVRAAVAAEIARAPLPSEED